MKTRPPKPYQKTEESGQSDTRFRTMFDTAAVGIGVMSLDRKLMDANPALCQMFKVPYEDLIGQTPAVVTYPEDYAESTRQFADLISGKMDTFRGERRYIRKNGEVFWAHVTMSLVRDRDSKPLYLIGMLMDIDDQKQALAELQESEARFRAMFDNVSVGMAMMSLERRVLAVNHTAEKIVGYQADELRGMDAALLSHPEDRVIGLEQFQKMVAGQSDGFRMEKRYLRKNGDVFWARITYSLVHSPDGKPQYLIGLIEDTTEQKLTAEKLADQEAEYLLTLEQRVEERTHELSESNLRLVNEIEQRQRAEESLANKAVEEAITAERTRLARDLHDAVTQTLFSASIIAEVLPELWQVDEAEAKNSTEELRQLTRGALAEMRTLLFELRPATLTQARFPDLLKQLSEAVIGRARLPVTLNVSGEYELPPDVKVAFYRIAQESLNNIVKYSRATQVEIRVQLDCCNVHLNIKDNGIGFDTSAVKTTSLGMRIMRERAENIHARLTISSTPGQGTEVSVVWNEDEIIPISKIFLRGEM
jgi:PAS domain S-box-containing protein